MLVDTKLREFQLHVLMIEKFYADITMDLRYRRRILGTGYIVLLSQLPYKLDVCDFEVPHAA